MNKIYLKANILLECHIVYAKISRSSNFYLLPILVHVRNEHGNATTETLSKDLFPNWVHVSQKLLKICEDDKLITKNGDKMLQYEITEKGIDAINNKILFKDAPSKMWEIYYANCGIIPKQYRILKIDEDPREAGYSSESNVETDTTTDHIKKLEGIIVSVPTSKNKPCKYRIDEISDSEKIIKSDYNAKLEWIIDGENSTMSLSFCDKKLIPKIEFSSTRKFNDVVEYVEQFLTQNGCGYYENDCLYLKFVDTTSKERKSMKRTIQRKFPLYNLNFDATISVSIYPDNDDEQIWANWLMGEKINAHLGNEYGKWRQEISELFSESDIIFKDKLSDYINSENYD